MMDPPRGGEVKQFTNLSNQIELNLFYILILFNIIVKINKIRILQKNTVKVSEVGKVGGVISLTLLRVFVTFRFLVGESLDQYRFECIRLEITTESALWIRFR